MRKQNSQIDWDDLRFFLAVMRSGQISHAARQLSVDHATVARRIDHLERTLDTMLFERGRGGYRPTAAADTLLLTVPNQLGVDYNAHVLESILTHVAPALGWR